MPIQAQPQTFSNFARLNVGNYFAPPASRTTTQPTPGLKVSNPNLQPTPRVQAQPVTGPNRPKIQLPQSSQARPHPRNTDPINATLFGPQIEIPNLNQPRSLFPAAMPNKTGIYIPDFTRRVQNIRNPSANWSDYLALANAPYAVR